MPRKVTGRCGLCGFVWNRCKCRIYAKAALKPRQHLWVVTTTDGYLSTIRLALKTDSVEIALRAALKFIKEANSDGKIRSVDYQGAIDV